MIYIHSSKPVWKSQGWALKKLCACSSVSGSLALQMSPFQPQFHTPALLRGGGVRTGQKSVASDHEGTMASIVRPQCHSQQAQPPSLSVWLSVASTALTDSEETRNPVVTERMEPPGFDNSCLVCILLAGFFWQTTYRLLGECVFFLMCLQEERFVKRCLKLIWSQPGIPPGFWCLTCIMNVFLSFFFSSRICFQSSSGLLTNGDRVTSFP